MRRAHAFMKRFIDKFAGLLLIGAVLSLAGSAKAQPSIQPIAPGIWAAGIPSNEFEFFAAPETEGHQYTVRSSIALKSC